jgi:hypothetical protein
LLRTPGQAAADVRAAHALADDADPTRGGLPLMGAAFTAGRVSREHVDVAVKAVRKLPQRVLSAPLSAANDPENDYPEASSGQSDSVSDETAPNGSNASGSDPDTSATASSGGDADGGDGGYEDGGHEDGGEAAEAAGASEVLAGAAVDAFFAQQSQGVDPGQARNLARHLLEALDPDGQDGFDPDEVDRRRLSHSTDAGGMVVGRFQLDPVTGAWFARAIEHFSPPDPTVEEETAAGGRVTVRDPRTAGVNADPTLTP